MRVELLYPSKYLKAVEFKGKDVTKTIQKVQMDDLTMVGGRKDRKPVVYFSDTEKMLVINKTNGMAIASYLGVETANWVGKKITMFPTKAPFQGKEVDCIRIKGSPDALHASELKAIAEAQNINK